MYERFYLRHTFTSQPFYLSGSLLGPDELEGVFEAVKDKELFNSKMAVDRGGFTVNKSARYSFNYLLEPEGPIFQSMKNFAERCNESHWRFPGPLIFPNLQFAKYPTGGHFDWHLDNYDQEKNLRIISVIALLNDPDSFAGGEFEIKKFSGETVTVPIRLGQMVAFPANLPHRVKRVEAGTRCTLGLSVLTGFREGSPRQIG